MCVSHPPGFDPDAKSFIFPPTQNPKFSDFVDKQTGYKTKCMLTFPLMADKECLGVVMALNKIGADSFTAEDEKVRKHAFHFDQKMYFEFDCLLKKKKLACAF